jgi:hypothetical protein
MNKSNTSVTEPKKRFKTFLQCELATGCVIGILNE